MRKVLAVFLLAVLAGYGSARFWERQRSVENGPITNRPARGKPSSDVQSSVDPIHWARTAGSATEASLSDWTEDEIRAALDKGVIANHGFAVVANLFGAWMKRNPDAAFSWFRNLRSETVLRDLAGTLAARWPRDRIDEGLQYLIANREMFEKHGFLWSGISWSPLVRTAMEESAKKSPEELASLMAVLKENKLRYGIGMDPEFPENFDFRKLASLVEAGDLLQSRPVFFAPVWVSRNPDEAFQEFVAKQLGDEETEVKELFSDVLPFSGKNDLPGAKARAGWLVGKLDAMPVADQRKVMADLLESHHYRDQWLVGDVASHLKDKSLGNEIVGKAIQEYVSGFDSFLSFSEGIDDVSWRVRQLESSNTDRLRMKGLSLEDEKLLRKKLVAWKVAPEKVESIVLRFKGGQP